MIEDMMDDADELVSSMAYVENILEEGDDTEDYLTDKELRDYEKANAEEKELRRLSYKLMKVLSETERGE